VGGAAQAFVGILVVACLFAAGPAQGAAPGGSASVPTATVSGRVTVDGVPFTGGKVPYGSLVDLVHGTITIKTDVGTLHAAGVPHVTAAFVLRRIRLHGRPYVELRLAKGNFGVCPKQKGAGGSKAAKRVVRALWSKGKGHFRTRGRFAAATVRGTHWRTDDRCDGTWTHVKAGVVDMTDFRTGKTVAVRAGHTFLVHPNS
jgi:hypothetical protein